MDPGQPTLKIFVSDAGESEGPASGTLAKRLKSPDSQGPPAAPPDAAAAAADPVAASLPEAASCGGASACGFWRRLWWRWEKAVEYVVCDHWWRWAGCGGAGMPQGKIDGSMRCCSRPNKRLFAVLKDNVVVVVVASLGGLSRGLVRGRVWKLFGATV